MNKGCGCLVGGGMFIVSLALLLVAGAWANHSYAVDRDWIPTEGVVVDLVRSRDSDGSDTFAPIVEYRTGEGIERRFQHTVSSGGALTSDIGDLVDVLYDPDDPDHAIVRSATGLWLGPILFGAFGILGLLVTVLGIWGVRRAGRRSGRSVTVTPTEDPTMDLMAHGYQVTLVRRGDGWVVTKA